MKTLMLVFAFVLLGNSLFGQDEFSTNEVQFDIRYLFLLEDAAILRDLDMSVAQLSAIDELVQETRKNLSGKLLEIEKAVQISGSTNETVSSIKNLLTSQDFLQRLNAILTNVQLVKFTEKYLANRFSNEPVDTLLMAFVSSNLHLDVAQIKHLYVIKEDSLSVQSGLFQAEREILAAPRNLTPETIRVYAESLARLDDGRKLELERQRAKALSILRPEQKLLLKKIVPGCCEDTKSSSGQ